jgi:hypothetical protein
MLRLCGTYVCLQAWAADAAASMLCLCPATHAVPAMPACSHRLHSVSHCTSTAWLHGCMAAWLHEAAAAACVYEVPHPAGADSPGSAAAAPRTPACAACACWTQ